MQQQDWTLARRYFLDAYKKDSAPRIAFNLGLVSTKTPGHELRAIAWFKAYLIAAPNAANAPAVREQITALEVKLESILGKMATELASKLPAALSGIDGYSTFFRDDFAARLAHIEALLGDVTAARTRLSNHKFESSFVGDGRWADLASVFARSGDIDSSNKLIQSRIRDDGEKAPAYNAIIESFLRDGKVADAIATAESIKARFARGSSRSSGLWPSQARAFARIACELGHKGDPARARELFKRAASATQDTYELSVIKLIERPYAETVVTNREYGMERSHLRDIGCPLPKGPSEFERTYFYKQPYEKFAETGMTVLLGDYMPDISTGRDGIRVSYQQLGLSSTSYDDTEMQKFFAELAQRNVHPFVAAKLSMDVLERFLVTWREQL